MHSNNTKGHTLTTDNIHKNISGTLSKHSKTERYSPNNASPESELKEIAQIKEYPSNIFNGVHAP